MSGTAKNEGMRRLLLTATLVFAIACGAVSSGALASQKSHAYFCAYAKRFPSLGRVYTALNVSPKYVGPLFCSTFNHGFRGRLIYRGSSPGRRLGTGVVYCAYRKTTSAVTMAVAVFADKKLAGQAFCLGFHPSGFRRTK